MIEKYQAKKVFSGNESDLDHKQIKPQIAQGGYVSDDSSSDGPIDDDEFLPEGGQEESEE